YAWEIGTRCNRKGQPHQYRYILTLGCDADTDGHGADDERGNARRLDLPRRCHVLAVAHHTHVQIMGHRRSGCQHQPRPPPMNCASSGPAMLPPASTAAMLAEPTFLAAPKPRNRVSTYKPPMIT